MLDILGQRRLLRLARNGPPEAQNRLPLFPQQPTFSWPSLTPVRDPKRLDPEDLREVLRAYQENCSDIIGRYDGHIAKYIGDEILVYFGYPQAHEDDAQRAMHAGIEIVAGVAELGQR